MFLSSENYLKQVKDLIKGSENLAIAVAFWGSGAEKLIVNSWQGKSLRIICNLASGGTNPRVIADLLKDAAKRGNIEIRTLDNLHAKVVIGDAAAIVGSANLSVNGLGLEEQECAGWQEAGVRLKEQSELALINNWFNQIWRQAENISENHLRQAWDQWRKNRISRPKYSKSIKDASNNDLKNRNIYIAIYQEDASDQAIEVAKKIELEAKKLDSLDVLNTELDFFEDWSDDGEEPLPKDAPIISMHYDPKKGLTGASAWVRIPQLYTTFIRKGTEKEVPLTMLGELKIVAGMPFTKADAKFLQKRLLPWVKELYSKPMSSTSRCLPLDDFIAWDANQSDRNIKL